MVVAGSAPGTHDVARRAAGQPLQDGLATVTFDDEPAGRGAALPVWAKAAAEATVVAASSRSASARTTEAFLPPELGLQPDTRAGQFALQTAARPRSIP